MRFSNEKEDQPELPEILTDPIGFTSIKLYAGLQMGCFDVRKQNVSNAIFQTSMNLKNINSNMPVSYTHLDVYKRQIPTCATHDRL